ncbi:MAG: FtsX-like permease family protein [Thermodesulfobacteriota bacterium]
MNLFRLAIKNVLRSRQRSAVTVSAMAFAGAIMIFYASLLEGWYVAMKQNAIGLEMGEMQVHAKGYRDDPDLYKLVTDEKRLVGVLRKKGLLAAPRLIGGGLAAAGSNSAGVMIRGIDLELEQQVTLLHRHVWHGQWLAGDDPAGVVIGRKLAKSLAVKVGDELVLVGQAADGSMANDLYRVRGILKSIGAATDSGGLIMSGAAFRQFMSLENGVHELVVKRISPALELTPLAQELRGRLDTLEVHTWQELQPVLARLFEMSNISLVIMLLITYAAVGILTLNAMLMSVFERIPEFGVMKALGVSGLNLFTLIVIETLILTTFAVTLSLVVGVPLSYHFSRVPLDFSWLLESSTTIAGIAFEPQWYCHLNSSSVILPTLFMYLVALIAIFYPAAKAALIRPVQAIHHH